jgi:hypothetical protein
MQFAIRLLPYGDYLTNMVVQGTGARRKYGGAGDRSIFGAENMVVQGTGAPKIWWCRGQVSRKEQNMVVQGTGQNSKANLFNSFQHFWLLSL